MKKLSLSIMLLTGGLPARYAARPGGPPLSSAFTGASPQRMTAMLRKQRRLLEDGRAAPGVIHKVTRTKNGKSVRYDLRLTR